MQAELKVYCKQDGKYIGEVNIDTADMPEELQSKVNKVILAHRSDCPYYQYSGVKLAGGGVKVETPIPRLAIDRKTWK